MADLPGSDATQQGTGALRQLVISIHGIRTRGVWQKRLQASLDTAGFNHEPLDYGYFSVFRFLSARARDGRLDQFMDEYERARIRNEGRPPSVIAHSFGSYLVGRAIRERSATFDRVILCGSLIPSDFNWSRYKSEGRVSAVLLDTAHRDIWPRLGRWVVGDCGDSGVTGFQDEASGAVVQRNNPTWKHSTFFFERNFADWARFLRAEDVQRTVDTWRQGNWRPLLVRAALLLVVSGVGWLMLPHIVAWWNHRLPSVHASCQAGDAAACKRLGDYYLPGDIVKAQGFYVNACDLGNAQACIALALSGREKRLTPESLQRLRTAERLLTADCAAGRVIACQDGGFLIHQGNINWERPPSNDVDPVWQAGFLWERGCSFDFQEACDSSNRLRDLCRTASDTQVASACAVATAIDAARRPTTITYQYTGFRPVEWASRSRGSRWAMIPVEGSAAKVTSVTVKLQLHAIPRLCDYAVILRSPEGTDVTLFDYQDGTRGGRPLPDCGRQDITVTVPSEGVMPSESLTKLAGENPNGLWAIKVPGTITRGRVSLIDWSLTVEAKQR